MAFVDTGNLMPITRSSVFMSIGLQKAYGQPKGECFRPLSDQDLPEILTLKLLCQRSQEVSSSTNVPLVPSTQKLYNHAQFKEEIL